MRSDLKKVFEQNLGSIEFNAEVGYRRVGNVRFRGKPSIQKLLLNVRNKSLGIDVNHLVLTVGKEIPAAPLVYSRIVPGMQIRFIGTIFPYTRKTDDTSDYSIKITKLLESKLKDSSILKEAWLNKEISSEEYLTIHKR